MVSAEIGTTSPLWRTRTVCAIAVCVCVCVCVCERERERERESVCVCVERESVCLCVCVRACVRACVRVQILSTPSNLSNESRCPAQVCFQILYGIFETGKFTIPES